MATWPSSSSSPRSGPLRRPALATAGVAGVRRKRWATTPCGTRPGTSQAARRTCGRLGGQPGPRRSEAGAVTVDEGGEGRSVRVGTGPGGEVSRARPLCDAFCGERRLPIRGKKMPVTAPPRTPRYLPRRRDAGALRTGTGTSTGNRKKKKKKSSRMVSCSWTAKGRRRAQTSELSPRRQAQKGPRTPAGAGGGTTPPRLESRISWAVTLGRAPASARAARKGSRKGRLREIPVILLERGPLPSGSRWGTWRDACDGARARRLPAPITRLTFWSSTPGRPWLLWQSPGTAENPPSRRAALQKGSTGEGLTCQRRTLRHCEA